MMKKTRLLVTGILLLFCLFCFFLPSTTGEDATTQTIYVGGEGAGNFTRIQDALDNVTVGGTVYVYTGTYHENLRVTKTVRLIGDVQIADSDGRQIMSSSSNRQY
jgi:hypothetical protein